MLYLEEGQKSDIFTKNNRNQHPAHLSFSVYYASPSNPSEKKTLDVVCKDVVEFNIWVAGLKWLIQNKEAVTTAAKDIDGAQNANRRVSLKQVNVANLRKEMNAHLDLCTWGYSAWGQLGHVEKPEEIRDIDSPKVKHYYYSFIH